MAGNKKPRRKHGLKPLSSQAQFEAMARGNQQRKKKEAKAQARVDKLNNLPLSHPMSRHMIEKTFGPVDRHLDEHERTGTLLLEDGTGEPVMYDGKDFIRIIPGMLHMCFIFEQIARARVWPKMPPGLRTYTIGLQIGRAIDADDFAGARETVAWMRKQLGTLSPSQWAELFDWATSLDEKEEQQNG